MPPVAGTHPTLHLVSRRDQDLRAELDKQLAPLRRRNLIDVWHDRQIDPGQEWDREIKRNLEEADIILLLVSAGFMDSDYAWSQEMERALGRHEAGEARVLRSYSIPVSGNWPRLQRSRSFRATLAQLAAGLTGRKPSRTLREGFVSWQKISRRTPSNDR